jgi:hypothetical protein
MVALTSLKMFVFWSFLIFGCVALSFKWCTYYFLDIKTLRTNNLSRPEVLELLKRTGSKIKQLLNKTVWLWETKRFGQSQDKPFPGGAHALCNIPPKKPCLFYSFGISDD